MSRKPTSTNPGALRNRAFRQRVKTGCKPLPVPWDYVSTAAIRELAGEAYRVASWRLLAQVHHPRLPLHELRRVFADELADMLRARVLACLPASNGQRGNAPEARAWRALRAPMPASWRPQYPCYEKNAPASVADTPGAAINADEGNVDALHSTP